MASGFTRSPRTLKGALIALDRLNPVASLVVFQYNPEMLRRSLTPQFAGQEDQTRGALRFAGPPVEQIEMTVELDATDQLEKGAGIATQLGIYPQLSALEVMLYPRSAHVIANRALARAGTIEVIQPDAPLTLLSWGVRRVVPVRLESFSIDEEAYDINLNPIRATVNLTVTVLTYNDLPLESAGASLYLAHQVAKEVLAGLGSSAALSEASDVAGLEALTRRAKNV